MRRLAQLLLVLALTGCGGAAVAESSSITMYGQLALTDGWYAPQVGQTKKFEGPCTGDGGYDDLHAGATVTVTDADGSVVALGSLGSGRLQSDGSAFPPCVFPFTVSDVPAGFGFYGVEVSHRGSVPVTGEEAAAGYVRLTIG